MKETGTIVVSDKFHTPAYLVVKCDNPNLQGNRSGELPMYHKEGVKVEFELVEIGDDNRMKWYARL